MENGPEKESMNNEKNNKPKEIEQIVNESLGDFKYKWGIEKLEKLIEKNPKYKEDTYALTSLGVFYDHLALEDDKTEEERKELEEKAFELYDKAIKQDPKCISAIWGKGRVYWHRGEEKALEYAKKAYKILKESDDKEKRKKAGAYASHLGHIYKDCFNNYEKAREWYKQGIKDSPETWQPYLTFINFAYEQDNLTEEEAEKFLPKLKRLHKEQVERDTKHQDAIKEKIDKLMDEFL